MARLVRNRIFFMVLASILLLAVILLSALPGSPLNHLTSPFSAVFSPVQKWISGTADKAEDFISSINDGMAIREENRQLHAENAALRSSISQLEEAGRQYNALKEAFSLKDRFASYDLIGGRLLTREIGTWFDVFRVDLGTADGIIVTEEITYAVVDVQSNLVGRVLSSDAVSAKILPLLHEGFSVSARINEVNGSLLRVRGDLDLKERGLCLVDQIPEHARISVGDEIVTSGIGGLFPAGIPVGRVVEIVDSAVQGQRQAWLEPYVKLEELETVFVMAGNTQ